MRLFATAVSGLRTQQELFDTTAGNVANINTPGFKAFKLQLGGAVVNAGNPADAEFQNQRLEADLVFGHSVIDMRQGEVAPAENDLDLAINGEGFFTLLTPNGDIGYSRAGAFRLSHEQDAAGRRFMSLTDPQGNRLQTRAPLEIPEEATNVSVSARGEITGKVRDNSGNEQNRIFGNIVLARFEAAEAMTGAGDNLFKPTAGSGQAVEYSPGSDGAGSIVPRALEQSNVDITKTLSGLIEAQRAYQVGSRLIQDADQMWGIANSIRR